MKLNKHVSRGLCSSRLLHNPDIRAVNRGEKKAHEILRHRRIKAAELARIEDRDRKEEVREQRKEAVAVTKVPLVKDVFGRIKGFFRRLGA
jgi:hypothetical protein